MRPADNPGRFSIPAQYLASAAQQRHLGWRILLPGLTQWSWHQRERGLVFLLSFLTSLVTGLFCWGSLVGSCFLTFCFFSHVAAYLDLARQRSFPIFRRTAALSAAALGLGLTVYLPTTLLLQSCAFATAPDPTTHAGYLVNRWAYQAKEPSPGHYIWMRLSTASAPRAGQVLAVAGQDVEWTGRTWRVDGNCVQPFHPGSLPYYPGAWGFRVPANHVLIEPEVANASPEATSALVLVNKNQIVGRAWARYYPFWESCLL